MTPRSPRMICAPSEAAISPFDTKRRLLLRVGDHAAVYRVGTWQPYLASWLCWLSDDEIEAVTTQPVVFNATPRVLLRAEPIGTVRVVATPFNLASVEGAQKQWTPSRISQAFGAVGCHVARPDAEWRDWIAGNASHADASAKFYLPVRFDYGAHERLMAEAMRGVNIDDAARVLASLK